jgi:hypothetical protein
MVKLFKNKVQRYAMIPDKYEIRTFSINSHLIHQKS